MSEEKKKLTPKQELFCKEYIIDLNATRAAIASGYSEKTANRIGPENLSKLVIQEYIQELTKEREKRTEITGDMVIKELAKIAFIQESDFYNSDGSAKLPHELTDEQRSALKSYSVKSIKVAKDEYEDIPIFVAHDKVKTLELLGKHFSLFTEKVEHSGPDGNPIETKWTIEFVKPKDE